MIRGMSALISDTAIACLTAAMTAAAWNWTFQVPIGIWLFLLMLHFLVNDMIARKGVSMNLYIIVNLAAVLGELAVVLRGAAWGHDSLAVILGIGICCVGGHCAAEAYHLPESNQLVRYVDLLIGMFGMYLYFAYQTKTSYDGICVGLTGAALLLDFYSINRLRTGEEADSVIQGAGAGGKLLLLLLICASFVFTGGIVGLASGQIHSIVDVFLYLLRCIGAAAAMIFGFVEKIFTIILLFIISFFPDAPPQTQEMLWQQMGRDTKEAVEEVGVVLPEWVIWLFFGCLLLGLFVMVLYQFRGVTVQRKKQKRSRKRIVRKSRLFQAIKACCLYLAEKLTFEWKYQKYKKTPQGLFVLAEREGKRHGCRRLIKESPGAYLRRLDPELGQLAELLDECYYAGTVRRLTEEEYRDYAEKISSVGKQNRLV